MVVEMDVADRAEAAKLLRLFGLSYTHIGQLLHVSHETARKDVLNGPPKPRIERARRPHYVRVQVGGKWMLAKIRSDGTRRFL